MANVSPSFVEDVISSLAPRHKKYIDKRYNEDERFRELYDTLRGKKRGNVSLDALLEYSYTPDEKKIEEMCKRDECFRELYAASKRMKVAKDSGDVGVSVSDYDRLPPTSEPERREEYFQRMNERTRIWELSDEDLYQELQSAVKEFGDASLEKDAATLVDVLKHKSEKVESLLAALESRDKELQELRSKTTGAAEKLEVVRQGVESLELESSAVSAEKGKAKANAGTQSSPLVENRIGELKL